MATEVTFDSNDLQTASIITSQFEHESIPVKEATLFALANANKSVLPIINYPRKIINIAGSLRASSIANLDALVDTFKGYFNGKEKNLDVGFDGGTRRYIATVNSLSIERPRGLGYANFAVQFVCTEPFGRDTTTTSALSANARTAGSYSDDHTFVGTAPFMLPVVTIDYNDVTTDTTEIVTNTGFETDLSGWSSGGVGTATRVTSQFHSGVASMQMANAGTAVGGYYGWELTTLTGLTAGESYTVRAWLKGNAGGESVTISLPNGGSTTTILTTSWQEVKHTFIADDSSMELDFLSSSPASGTWFLDDVSVKKNSLSYVSFSNATNGQGILITGQAFAADDVLVIDCDNKIVTLNGTEIDFIGAFPEFPPGEQSFSYADGFTTRNFDIDVDYYPLYL